MGQKALELYLTGQSFNRISQSIKPSRWTIVRWIKRLNEKFAEHALHLKSRWPDLGYHTKINDFWSALLKKINLSQAMIFLNSESVFVP
jgi:hypothetical protein